MSDHATAERRSLRYHRAIGARLASDATILARARVRVVTWIERRSVAEYYALGWQEALDAPLETIRAFLAEDSERARAFRQVSPFAGVLTPSERWQLWKAEGKVDDSTAA